MPTCYFATVFASLEIAFNWKLSMHWSYLALLKSKSIKTAVIKPLLKKRSLNPSVLNTYRPVFNLPFIRKRRWGGHSTCFMTAYCHSLNNVSTSCLTSSVWFGHSTSASIIRALIWVIMLFLLCKTVMFHVTRITVGAHQKIYKDHFT